MTSSQEAWRPVLKNSGQPVYIRIADAIGDDILAGRLGVGERLPPLRDLAETLQLNYATVSRGYGEAQRRGLIYSRVGQGSFVCRFRPMMTFFTGPVREHNSTICASVV